MKTKEEIDHHLFYRMTTYPTEVGMAFGCRSVSGSVARETARLYHNGAFLKIIVTGGIKAGSLMEMAAVGAHCWKRNALRDCFNGQALRDFTAAAPEADYMAAILKEEGVPGQAIIHHDNQSRHTQQNLMNCRTALADFRSATLITYAPTQRRVLGTARLMSEFKHILLQTVPVFPFGISKENWDSGLIGKLVRGEYDKIDPSNPHSYIGKYCLNPDVARESARNEWRYL